jgi:hypothetical protein
MPDPRFNINLNLSQPATISASAARLTVSGSGALTGSLSKPRVTADLRVRQGQLRLPTSRVNVDPGGTLKLIYQVDEVGQTTARLDVNMEGHTTVTALAFNDQVQRYDVTLGIRGNLLEEGETQLTASSDPPDLNQAQILAMIGQADVIGSLANTVPRSEAERRLQGALTSVALPAVFDPITSRLAAGLGLESLSLEYNPYEQASIAFAKVLGRRLTLSGFRQISPALPGQLQHWNVSIDYRLPFHRRILNRMNLSLGADQDRPWKLSLNYTVRF